CHRIVRGDGSWGHYAFGHEMKTLLLTLERATPVLVGCTTTRIVCRRGCAHDQRVAEQHRVVFASLAHARSARSRPCPVSRPYRTRDDMGSWHEDTGVAAYVEERLKRGVYRGIGEFHLDAAAVDAPVVRRIAELAAERDLFLHAHVDAETIEKLLGRYPKVR